MRFLTDTDDEVFDLLISYAGSNEVVSEVLSRPGRDHVSLSQVIMEIDELLASRKTSSISEAGTPGPSGGQGGARPAASLPGVTRIAPI
ncbi:hypothetical protein [Variovorax saccharolyticus]|uniref:hypothetical protein n=1 Tax=Variovorax saccharolyticus TaxID=3053516 RepID=UPI00257515CC|nr:hypothetical protein [Variovorax sp. J31P216]MDM0025912.1 hypothetical protein [Variovorax sp. J31P216]